jgi:hypothetical protein
MVYAHHIKLFPEALELFTHTVLVPCPQNNFLGVHPSGGQKVGSLRVMSQECKEDKG